MNVSAIPSTPATVAPDGPPIAASRAPGEAERSGRARVAVLLLDLQLDFLDPQRGKMPVPGEGAARVVAAANHVLRGEVLAGALPVLIVNQFPRGAVLGNCFRHGAALAGSPGAGLDPRIAHPPHVRIFSKARDDAFSNAALETYLREQGVGTVWVLGVMSEGCVRATALAARRLGFEVLVAQDAIATTAAWKARLAIWLMRRGGVRLVECLAAPGR